MTYDIAIIGSGPAGLTAGIYTGRAKHSTIIFEGDQPGGQLTTTTIVENWPGEKSINGPDLMEKMQEHAKAYGCAMASETISKVDLSSGFPFKLITQTGNEFAANSIIIASGASHKMLGCSGEKEYFSKGVSVCATCDAPFYMDKEVIVVGGGDSAVTEADHLARFAKQVTIVHILDKLTAIDPIKYRVLENPKIKIIYNSTVKEIQGDGQNVTQVLIENRQDKADSTIKASGVFVAIGFNPNTKIFKSQIELDRYGYVVLKGKTMTDKPGIFAAGDVADYKFRQAITAAGTGCMAALDAMEYLKKKA
jgi:thioredoxin reductase (NADPH)